MRCNFNLSYPQTIHQLPNLSCLTVKCQSTETFAGLSYCLLKNFVTMFRLILSVDSNLLILPHFNFLMRLTKNAKNVLVQLGLFEMRLA